MVYISTNKSLSFQENQGRDSNVWEKIHALKILIGSTIEKDVGMLQGYRILVWSWSGLRELLDFVN